MQTVKRDSINNELILYYWDYSTVQYSEFTVCKLEMGAFFSLISFVHSSWAAHFVRFFHLFSKIKFSSIFHSFFKSLFEILFVHSKNIVFQKLARKSFVQKKNMDVFYKNLFDNWFVQKKNNSFFPVRSNDFKSIPISTVNILTCKSRSFDKPGRIVYIDNHSWGEHSMRFRPNRYGIVQLS